MGSRRAYPTAELYEERSRDYYGNGNRSYRDYDELDLDIGRGGRPQSEYSSRGGRQPDFLRDDYGRTTAGPLVVSDRRIEEDFGRPPVKPRREVEREELVIRDRKPERPPPSVRDLDREEIVYRRDERGPPPRPRDIEREELIIRRDEREERPRRPREVERDDIDISIRRDEREERPRRPRDSDRDDIDISIRHREQSRPRPRDVERDELIIRRDDRGPPPRPRDVERDELIIRREEREEPPRRPREIERDEIIFRRGEGSRPPPREPRDIEREEIRIRRNDSRPPPRSRDVEREEITFRRTEEEPPRPKSVPPPRGELVAREKEEFVIRRRQPPSPPREEKQEIIIRRTERSPSPSPPPSPPPPPPPPEPIVRPPIVQEIITHHRHIDHGVERARSPTPPPPPPSPPKDESLEIAIRSRRGGPGSFYDEDIIFERETRERKEHDHELELTRRRSMSAPRRRATRDADFDIDAEADFYNRKAQERAYIGEAYNGATKDWAIVDVPPGTNRVRMDGIGGGSQEVTWQRYNGVRRSKFITEDREYPGEFGAPAPPRGEIEPPPSKSKPKTQDMWTEITKDLVTKEAIEAMHYDYEETDYFFYVMEYLRYEDVLRLVEISDDIRRERRQRIRELEFERSELDRKPRPGKYDYYEREIFYERDDRRGRYR